MKLRRMHHRIQVQLPVTLASDLDAKTTPQRIFATCTSLSGIGARLTADLAPEMASGVSLTVTLPGNRHASVRGKVVWSQTTTAPSLLCGGENRMLGAIFEVEFEPGSVDLTYLTDLVESRLYERRARVRRIIRRAGIGVWQPA